MDGAEHDAIHPKVACLGREKLDSCLLPSNDICSPCIGVNRKTVGLGVVVDDLDCDLVTAVYAYHRPGRSTVSAVIVAVDVSNYDEMTSCASNAEAGRVWNPDRESGYPPSENDC